MSGELLSFIVLHQACHSANASQPPHHSPRSAPERSERISLRIIGTLFLALGAYVAADALQSLIARQAPDASPVGLVLAVASLVVMPLLANAKRRVAVAMGSGALAAESRQTMLCTYLPLISAPPI